MRGDERTETSRTRHHLQGGVSAVKPWSAAEQPTRTKTSSRRSDGRTRESDGHRGVLRRGQSRFVLAPRKWCAPKTPARPPAAPRNPAPLPDAKTPRRLENLTPAATPLARPAG